MRKGSHHSEEAIEKMRSCRLGRKLSKVHRYNISKGVSRGVKRGKNSPNWRGEKASYITPVPGGVGPLTVAVLLKNVLALARAKNK